MDCLDCLTVSESEPRCNCKTKCFKMAEIAESSSQSPEIEEDPAPLTLAKKQKPSIKKSSSIAKKPSHPATSELVLNAITTLQERNGSSLQAIKKFIATNYKLDTDKMAPFIKKYLKNAVGAGKLIQTKGKGASGSFKMSANVAAKPKNNEKKKKIAKTKSNEKKVKKSVDKKEKKSKKEKLSAPIETLGENKKHSSLKKNTKSKVSAKSTTPKKQKTTKRPRKRNQKK